MANRSYLYATEFVPDGDAPNAPIGLSERSGMVALVQKLMMGGFPERVDSAIWSEQRTGIIANRKGASARVLAFYDKVLEGELARRDELVTQLEQMKAVLARTPSTPYLLLEAAEILALNGTDPEGGTDAIVEEIDALARRAERAIAGRESAWLAKLRNSQRDELDLREWCDELFVSFAELSPKVLAKRRLGARPRAVRKTKKTLAQTTKVKSAASGPEVAGHTRAVPRGTLMPPLAMRDPARTKTPTNAFLASKKDPPLVTAEVRCWSLNEDPPHVLAPAVFEVGVIGEREVYWGAPDREAPPHELNFLLRAIIGVETSRPRILDRVIPEDAVAAVVQTPSGRTLMVCPRKFALALENAVAKARAK